MTEAMNHVHLLFSFILNYIKDEKGRAGYVKREEC